MLLSRCIKDQLAELSSPITIQRRLLDDDIDEDVEQQNAVKQSIVKKDDVEEPNAIAPLLNVTEQLYATHSVAEDVLGTSSDVLEERESDSPSTFEEVPSIILSESKVAEQGRKLLRQQAYVVQLVFSIVSSL